MAQTKLSFTLDRATAARIMPALEAAFEEDGFPIALLELDEQPGHQEIALYFDEDPKLIEPRLIEVITAQDIAVRPLLETLPDVDWVAHSLEGLKPVRAGRFLVHGSHDRHHKRIGDLAIEIEAGLAFGTGHHGTTSGCLEMIDRVVRREHPRSALDLGTGSAVLAIALAKLSRIPVLATDIDPVATRVAHENAVLNGVSSSIEAVTATGFHHPVFALRGPFDLIVANILARPLMYLAPQMVRHARLGGSLILSGILDRQRDAVVAAYANQQFRQVRTIHREGWVTIHMKR